MSSSSGSTITEIVTKYVLPTVMQTLITASNDLSAGLMSSEAPLKDAALVEDEDPSVIITKTSNYIVERFNTTFGYAYNAQTSIPSNMAPKEQAVLLGTGEYVGFYSNDQAQIQHYLNAMFADTIFPNDSRIGAKFIQDFLDLITSQLSQQSDTWVPFNTTKRYVLISDPTTTVAVDMMAVLFTASAQESVDPSKPSAFINYALVAYNTVI